MDGVDMAMNGLQVGRFDLDVQKMAFAVDACMDSFRQAREAGAQALFVHHGLFWGKLLPLTDYLGERVRFLMNNDMALYAVHLPLDSHEEVGNNARIASVLGLCDVEPFGDYKGHKIGFKGVLRRSLGLQEVVEQLIGDWEPGIRALRFGPPKVSSIAVISGGGIWEVTQAAAEGMDLYITGDASHNIYHECREKGINIISAGHYNTETFGVKAVAERVEQELNLDTLFISIPTGL